MNSGDRSGYAALLGRPNVGKSTLLNRLVGQKISITASKPQTTRHSILGISTHDQVQIVFVDTPGLHQRRGTALNRQLNRTASGSLGFADVVLFVTEARRWTPEDDNVVARLSTFTGPVVAVVNKVDQLGSRAAVLPILQRLSEIREFAAIVPVSAQKNLNLGELETVLGNLLPYAPFIFPEQQVTNVSMRFLAAELIREKLTRRLRDELPYALTVEIEAYEEDGDLVRIAAVIWVEREGQKGIIIGERGVQLREIGRQARLELEQQIGRKVHLKTWVKVRAGWSDDERALNSLGYLE